MDLKKLIGEMTQARGLPGYEGDVAAIFCREMEKIGLKTDTDAIGNATAYMGKAGGPRIMATAHLDEIGLIVTEILDDGALRFTRMGGVDPRILPGSKVRVYTKEGKLTGVIGAKPPHLLTAAERKKNLEMKDMYIDMGMSAERVKQTVRVGDLVALDGPLTELAGGRLASKTMDDRACVAAMCLAAEQLKDVDLKGEVCFVAAGQEEVGSRGATTATYRLNPDLAIAFDVTHGQMPDCKPQEVFPLDKVVMSIGPNIHPAMHARIMETARKNGIAVQGCVCGGLTSTDAEVTQVSRMGVPTVLIELPLKYMHTTVETLSLDTTRECARLLSCFVREILAEWGNIQWQ